MTPAISIGEILRTIQDGNVEVCAGADAEYDQSAQQMSVTLSEHARRVSASRDGQQPREPWLPAGERIQEHTAREDADKFTKDEFQSGGEKGACICAARARHPTVSKEYS